MCPRRILDKIHRIEKWDLKGGEERMSKKVRLNNSGGRDNC